MNTKQARNLNIQFINSKYEWENEHGFEWIVTLIYYTMEIIIIRDLTIFMLVK